METGVQEVLKASKILDSGFRRNDRKRPEPDFFTPSGRARVGLILGNFSHLRGGKGGGDVLNIFLQRLGSGRPFSPDNLPVAGEETKMAIIRCDSWGVQNSLQVRNTSLRCVEGFLIGKKGVCDGHALFLIDSYSPSSEYRRKERDPHRY